VVVVQYRIRLGVQRDRCVLVTDPLGDDMHRDTLRTLKPSWRVCDAPRAASTGDVDPGLALRERLRDQLGPYRPPVTHVKSRSSLLR
jgi:hypothetical protein